MTNTLMEEEKDQVIAADIEKTEEIEKKLENKRDKIAMDIIGNAWYDFEGFYVKPRSYVFDGELLYYIYDIVNNDDTSSVLINPVNEDAEVTYFP